jgi:urease accessory protein
MRGDGTIDSVHALLTALRHGDSAFPSGSFAFSQGLEGLTAVAGGKPGEAAIAAFIREQIRHRWASAERVALTLAYRAGAEIAVVANIDRDLDGSTFCATLRDGSTRNGRALLATHRRLGTPGADGYGAAVAAGETPGTLACVQGFVWRAIGLDEGTAVALSGYGLVAGSLAAGVRLGFVGALRAQALTGPLLAEVAQACAMPVAADAEIAGFAPFADIAAMRQATLPLRLFSN